MENEANNKIENCNKINNIEEKTTDIYWLAEEITPYIIKFLMKTFPRSLIKREFNNVDIMVLDENLPIEIQATHIRHDRNNSVNISKFEDDIRRQLEQNIEISGRCWLFIDEKFIRHINTSLNEITSINMDWLYQLWKLEKVKIFTITYNGTIREITKEDWKFLSKMSQTCKISADDDYRILQKNKAIIFCNILKAYGFTTEEMNNMYDSFLTRENNKKYINFNAYLNRKESTAREIQYADIIYSISMITNLNNALCHSSGREYVSNIRLTFNGTITGLFERNEASLRSSQSRIRFSDKYNIAKYFPGYIRNKDIWDYLKTRWLTLNEFYGLITGEYQFSLIKNQKSLMDY